MSHCIALGGPERKVLVRLVERPLQSITGGRGFLLDPNTGLLSAARPSVTIGSHILNETGTFDPSGKYLFFYDTDGILDEYQPLLNPSQAALSSPSNRFAIGLDFNADNLLPQGVYPLE